MQMKTKSKSKSKLTRQSLVLQDELQPQIGGGYRIVEAKVGLKWGRGRDVARAKLAPTTFKRIKRRDWDTLVKQSNEYFERNNSNWGVA